MTSSPVTQRSPAVHSKLGQRLFSQHAQWTDLPYGCEISSSKPKPLNKIEVFYSECIAECEHGRAEKDFPMYIILSGEGGVGEKCKTAAFLTGKGRQDGSQDPYRT